MIKQKFLWVIIAFTLIFQQTLIGSDKDDTPTTKGKVANTKHKSNDEEIDDDNIIDTRPPLHLIKHQFNSGFFYRTSDYKDMDGVYAKKALYYDINLLEDKQNIYSFVAAQNTGQQYLGIVFFGIWSYPNSKKNTTSDVGEIIEIIEVPVRQVNDKKMFYKPQDADNKLYPRLIWETGHEKERVIKEEERKYRIIPCKGSHTEKKFKNFIKDETNQKALWNYFIEESKDVTHKERKLDLVGFKCYSSFDACDECFERLLNLQSDHENVLTHLPPQEMLTSRRVPFQIVFHANSFYHPSNDGEYGSSLYFYPIRIAPLIRLHGYNKGEKSYECRAISNGKETKDEINHQDDVNFKEFNQLNFIILKIRDGEKKDVILKASLF